ncbi:MAG: M23 family metallopeptidase [Spirochaetes bacterium]|nr:M23 family metallopeptidase [Spirochaetota bacterium]
MKKTALAVLLLIFFASYLSAAEKILIDNDQIQQYNGKLGIWESFSSFSALERKVRIYGTTISAVKSLNSDFNEKQISGYYFIPYSESYIESLKEKGIERKEVTLADGYYLWPVHDVMRITSTLGPRWGRFHAGLDIAAVPGTIVVAAMEGMVIKAEYESGYGNVIVIEHRNKFTTKYAHNKATFVKVGDFIQKGQIISLVGSTGRSTGPHLHFEVRCNNIPLEPMDFLPEEDEIVVHKLQSDESWKRETTSK